MTKNDKIQNGRSLFKKIVYKLISTKKNTNQRNIFNISSKSLSTLKSFYIDTYYFISVKYEMYNKALSLYFIPPY